MSDLLRDSNYDPVIWEDVVPLEERIEELEGRNEKLMDALKLVINVLRRYSDSAKAVEELEGVEMDLITD